MLIKLLSTIIILLLFNPITYNFITNILDSDNNIGHLMYNIFSLASMFIIISLWYNEIAWCVLTIYDFIKKEFK